MSQSLKTLALASAPSAARCRRAHPGRYWSRASRPPPPTAARPTLGPPSGQSGVRQPDRGQAEPEREPGSRGSCRRRWAARRARCVRPEFRRSTPACRPRKSAWPKVWRRTPRAVSSPSWGTAIGNEESAATATYGVPTRVSQWASALYRGRSGNRTLCIEIRDMQRFRRTASTLVLLVVVATAAIRCIADQRDLSSATMNASFLHMAQCRAWWSRKRRQISKSLA